MTMMDAVVLSDAVPLEEVGLMVFFRGGGGWGRTEEGEEGEEWGMGGRFPGRSIIVGYGG